MKCFVGARPCLDIPCLVGDRHLVVGLFQGFKLGVGGMSRRGKFDGKRFEPGEDLVGFTHFPRRHRQDTNAMPRDDLDQAVALQA